MLGHLYLTQFEVIHAIDAIRLMLRTLKSNCVIYLEESNCVVLRKMMKRVLPSIRILFIIHRPTEAANQLIHIHK